MAQFAVTVMGAGVAGLAAALKLARNGHQVTLLERDDLDVGSATEAPAWPRRGIPHFLQPHAFTPRGRSELKAQFPDVYQALLRVGADDIGTQAKMPGEVGPGDEELQYLGVRRPVIEWALRRAVRAQSGITVRAGAQVEGLRVDSGRISAIRVDGAELPVQVLVDALGRRSPIGEWLTEGGLPRTPEESSDCGVVYYSRYYQVRPGFVLPDGPWPLSPRGDLGYLGFSSFPGDNGTFSALLAVPRGSPEWRVLRNVTAFEAAIAEVPMLRQWADPDGVVPLTDVLPMAGLRNTYRAFDDVPVAGLFTVGDALSHTDPVLAHGLAFGLIHAGELAAALRVHADLGDASAAYTAATSPALRERFDLATALDEQRQRMWMGEPVNYSRHDGDYALFTMVAGGAAASVDPEIFRVFLRRIGLLDSTAVLDQNLGLQLRIEAIFQGLLATPRPPAGPPRDEMLGIVTAAAG